MRQIKLLTLMALSTLFIFGNAYADLLLNGSFENTSSSGCDSNNSNAAFNAEMSNVTAWGARSEIDIYSGACFGPNAPIDGNVKLHLNNATDGTFDAFNFDLASSLVNGAIYNLSFYAASQSAFGQLLGAISVGTSSDATTFGAGVFTGSSSVLDTWEFFSTSFVAGPGANFLSVKISSDTADAWIAVDGFRLTATTAAVPEPGTLALLGLGLLGMAAMRRKKA